MRQVYALYTWLFFIPLIVLDCIFFGAVCLLLWPFLSARHVGFATAIPWARIGLFFSGVKVTVHGREHLNKAQGYVVVANHLSLFDILVLYGWTYIDLRWVVKKELRYVPIVGICCTALGHVFVDRSNPEKAIASLQKSKKRMVNGTSILFFPEGTRSRDGKLQRFKKGAFHMAKDLNLPVLPISIQGTREILPSDTSRLTPGKEVTLVIHPPIEIGGRDANELARLSHSVISAGLQASSSSQT